MKNTIIGGVPYTTDHYLKTSFQEEQFPLGIGSPRFCHEPPVAAAAIAAIGSYAAGTAILGLTVLQTAILSGVASLALSALSGAFSAPKVPDISEFARIKGGGTTKQVRQPITPRRMVYGEARVSGPFAYITSTSSNQYLHMVIMLASHQVNEIGEVWLNDTPITPDQMDANGNVTSGRYSGVCRIIKHDGDPTQGADSSLVSEVTEWTTDHRLQGIAYLYVRLKYDRNKYPSGIPNISAWVKGKEVLDTRDNTIKWTHNAMLLSNDYLTDDEYGVGASASDVDADYVDAGANVCEEFVTTTTITHNVKTATASTDIIEFEEDVLLFQTGDRVTMNSSGSLPTAITAITENLFLQSENIVDGSYWKDARGVLSSDQIKSPISNQVTADLFIEDTSSGAHYIYQDITINQQINHTCSIYVKANGRSNFRIRLFDSVGSGDISIDFDLDAESYVEDNVDASSSFVGASIDKLDNDWYRISVTGIVNTSGGTNQIRFYFYSLDGTTRDYVGDDVSGFYVFGAQLEADAVLNEYVATTTTPVTASTNYYVIVYQRKSNSNKNCRIKLATSYDNALEGIAVDFTSSGSGTMTVSKNAEPRYSAGGTVETDSTPEEILSSLTGAMAGKAIHAGGQWRLYAGSYDTPTMEFDESDLAGPIEVQTKTSERDRFNSVIGTYVSPLNYGVPDDYPEVKNDTYISEDGKKIRYRLEQTFVQRPHQSQRLAKVALEKMRQEFIYKAKFKLTAFKTQCGENINLSHAIFGWSSKAFEVLEWEIGVEEIEDTVVPIIEMKLKETASTVYDWNNGEETQVDPAPNTNLPNAFDVEAVTGLTFDSFPLETRDGDIIYKVIVGWNQPSNAFVTEDGRIEIEYKLSSDINYFQYPPLDGSSTEAEIFSASAGLLYDIRIRAINNLGVASNWNGLLGVSVGSAGGITASSDWGAFVSDPVSESDDWGAFLSDPVAITDDWGSYV